MQRFTWSKLVVLIVALFVGSGCSSLRFRKVSVLGAVTDAKTQSTRVSVAFEVYDGAQPLSELPSDAFTVYEDGRVATREAWNEVRTTNRRVPVVLLLDTSAGMVRSGALPALKRAASRFTDELGHNGFHITTYSFGARIKPVADITALPESLDDQGSESATVLYAAVSRALAKQPDAIVVVFSAAADSGSGEQGVAGLSVVEGKVLPEDLGGNGEERVLYAIGFGNLARERDRQGVAADLALERLARNGSYSFARDERALDAAFAEVSQRLRNLRVYDFVSSKVTGRHDLVIEVRAHGHKGETERLWFVAGATALRAKFTRGGGLVWNGPQAAVQDAVDTADRCAQASSESLANEACAALVVIAESTQDADSIAAVRSFIGGSVCQRFAVSGCEETRPAPATTPP